MFNVQTQLIDLVLVPYCSRGMEHDGFIQGCVYNSDSHPGDLGPLGAVELLQRVSISVVFTKHLDFPHHKLPQK